MNSPNNGLDINTALKTISKAVMKSLTYKVCDKSTLENAISYIDTIVQSPALLIERELDFTSGGQNYVLFFISNIIYNLKPKNDFVMTPDTLTWLGCVWKDFLLRNKSYQELFFKADTYRKMLSSYYPSDKVFISQIKNINLVKDDFINKNTTGNAKLMDLKNFYQSLAEITSWMRPSYFFLLDYFYEMQLHSGENQRPGVDFEKEGMSNFGQHNYTYKDLLALSVKCLGILEAVYLILRKKKSLKRIFNIDGKQKFLSVGEIYTIYLKKFNETKNNLHKLNLNY